MRATLLAAGCIRVPKIKVEGITDYRSIAKCTKEMLYGPWLGCVSGLPAEKKRAGLFKKIAVAESFALL